MFYNLFQFIGNRSVFYFSFGSLKIPFILNFLLSSPLLLMCQESLQYVFLTKLWCFGQQLYFFFVVFSFSLIASIFGNIWVILLDANPVNLSTDRSRAHVINSELEFNSWSSFLFLYRVQLIFLKSCRENSFCNLILGEW